MIKPRMTTCLKQLHLPAFAEHYAPQAALAVNEGWPYDRYLLGLCELELTEREQRRIQRLLVDSKLPREKTLEMFDRNRIKKTVDRQFAVLQEGDFLDRRENVLAFGNPGSGKTHLLCALGHELVRKGRPVYFVPCALLVQRLLLAKAELWLEKELKRLDKFDALCVFRGKSSTDSDPKSSTHSDASHPVIPGAKHPAIPTRRHPLFGAYRNDWMSWRNRQPDSQ